MATSDPPGERPDVVLPVQFFGGMRRCLPNKTGEYRLLIAVLEDAILSFQEYAFATTRRGRRLFAEVERWIMDERTLSRSDPTAPRLSFEYVCGVLGLDPPWLRQGLRRWYTARAAGRTLTTVLVVPPACRRRATDTRRTLPP